jgi:hypothetical protein
VTYSTWFDYEKSFSSRHNLDYYWCMGEYK